MADMKTVNNDVSQYHYNGDEALKSSLDRLCRLISDEPSVLQPCQDKHVTTEKLFSGAGFQLYSTVKKTTLVYDPGTECFFKVLHPLKFRDRLLYLFINRAESIYHTMEFLHGSGIEVQRVLVHGVFRAGRRPFFGVKKAEGESLYDILIRQKQRLTMADYEKVMDSAAQLHNLGYWFGDAHLSHFFIKGGRISGIIDVDGIRRNRPFMLKNPAKDIAGLNHPEIPLSEDEKRSLLAYYSKRAGIHDQAGFLRLLKRYTERRWT